MLGFQGHTRGLIECSTGGPSYHRIRGSCEVREALADAMVTKNHPLIMFVIVYIYNIVDVYIMFIIVYPLVN